MAVHSTVGSCVPLLFFNPNFDLFLFSFISNSASTCCQRATMLFGPQHFLCALATAVTAVTAAGWPGQKPSVGCVFLKKRVLLPGSQSEKDWPLTS